MVSDQRQFPTDQEIDASVDHYYAFELGATNGRWWDDKRHCSSPTVEAREFAGFLKSMRDHEIAWIARSNRYAVSCTKDPAKFQPFQPEVVSFRVNILDGTGNVRQLVIGVLVETTHPKEGVKTGVRFFGHSLPPRVSSGMSYYLKGEYDWDMEKKVGLGWMETEETITPDRALY